MEDSIPVQEVSCRKENGEISSNSPNRVNVAPDRRFEVPHGYDDNKVVLMVRDPWTVFAYWEIKKEVEDSVKTKIAGEGLTVSKSILRVYSVAGGNPHNDLQKAFDFELRDWACNWYVHTREPGKEWMVDIGILCTTGEFFCLARSNVVRTPPHGMSDIYDENWMCPEELYYKMFAAAGGYGVGKSSLEMKEMIGRHLREWLSSGGISSGMFGSASLFMQKK